MIPRRLPPKSVLNCNCMGFFNALTRSIEEPIINANANMVAENIGIPFSGRYVVSIYLIDVSMTPEPKNSKTGSQRPLVMLLEVFGLTEVRYTEQSARIIPIIFWKPTPSL